MNLLTLESLKDENICIFFWALSYVMWLGFYNFVVTPIFEKFLKHRVQPKRHSHFKNLMTSWVHSLLSAIGAALVLWYELRQYISEPTDLMKMNRVTTPKANFAYAQLVGIGSMGYFVHDTLDYIYHFGVKKSLDIIGHHAIIFLLCWPGVLLRSFIAMSMLCLIVEFNNVFLHMRRLLLWSGILKDDFAYELNAFLLMVTFIPFRVALFSFTCYTSWLYIFEDHEHNEAGGVINSYPTWLPFSMYLIVNVMNVTMFMQLWNADVMYYFKNSKSKRT